MNKGTNRNDSADNEHAFDKTLSEREVCTRLRLTEGGVSELLAALDIDLRNPEVPETNRSLTVGELRALPAHVVDHVREGDLVRQSEGVREALGAIGLSLQPEMAVQVTRRICHCLWEAGEIPFPESIVTRFLKDNGIVRPAAHRTNRTRKSLSDDSGTTAALALDSRQRGAKGPRSAAGWSRVGNSVNDNDRAKPALKIVSDAGRLTRKGAADYREEVLAALIAGSLKTVQIPKDEPSEERAESIIRNMPSAPPIEFGRLRTYTGSYYVNDDKIWILAELKGKRSRYPVIFHELAHATGHSKRLNRRGLLDRTNAASVVCREEILAELSALYLCLEAGMFWTHKNVAASYIKKFLGHLNAKTPETRAAVLRPLHAEALKVVGFILGVGSRTRAATTTIGGVR